MRPEHVLQALIASKRAELAALEAALAGDRVGETVDRWYTAARPAPRHSWRATREIAHRRGIRMVRDGRSVLVDAAAFDAALEASADSPTAAKQIDDAAAYGLVVPLRRSGGR